MAWTAPRTWVASEFVTASICNTHIRDNFLASADRVQAVRKSADEPLTSSTVLQNDDELLFTVVAGQTYVFTFTLMVTSATAAADIKCGLSFPAGTMSFGVIGQDLAATTNTSQVVINSNAAATTGVTAFSVAALSGATMVTITGTFLCTTGGTVRLMWAQDTSSATAVNVKAGSNLLAIRAAA